MSGQRSLISIIIPSYNRSLYLSDAINSVFRQTYRPVECLIVDDGSTDNTKEIVLKLQQSSPEGVLLHYFFQKNSGVQAARNAGTAAAIGDFIQYLDSDDLLYPEKLKNQIEFLNHHPDCDGVFGDWQSGDEKKSEMVKAFASNDLIAQFLTDRCIANFSFLMRKEIVKKTGDWDITVKRNQEIDFHVRAVLAGGNFQYQEITTGLWRTHDDSRIANTTGLKEVMWFYKKMERLLIKENKFDKVLAVKISQYYLWYFSQNLHQPIALLCDLLMESLRLDSQVSFYNNRMKYLSFFLGKRTAILFWIFKFKKSKK